MRPPTNYGIFGVILFASGIALAQTPAEVFHEMDSRKRASLGAVADYSVKKSTMGMCTFEYFEKATTTAVDGRGTVAYMHRVPPAEIAQRNSADSPLANASPEELDAAAAKLRQHAPELDRQMRGELQSAGLPGGLGYMITNPPGDKPWLSPMPNDMLGNYATMLEGAAEGKRLDAAIDAQEEQDAQTDSLAQLAERTRITGRETINNREAIVLVSDGLNYTQQTNDQDFTLHTLRLWVDANDYVALKMRMEGVARDGKESREIRIEREDMDYRAVPGCSSLNEPFRTVMRIAGVLNAKEQAQMDEAKVKLAEFETQLASMPPDQKAMIMRQMGPQLEMMRNMTAGNGIEVVSEVVAMRCNTGTPSTIELAQNLPVAGVIGCDSSPSLSAG